VRTSKAKSREVGLWRRAEPDLGAGAVGRSPDVEGQ
jgi:hypothetical protein